jgi:hypothetical protein
MGERWHTDLTHRSAAVSPSCCTLAFGCRQWHPNPVRPLLNSLPPPQCLDATSTKPYKRAPSSAPTVCKDFASTTLSIPSKKHTTLTLSLTPQNSSVVDGNPQSPRFLPQRLYAATKPHKRAPCSTSTAGKHHIHTISTQRQPSTMHMMKGRYSWRSTKTIVITGSSLRNTMICIYSMSTLPLR